MPRPHRFRLAGLAGCLIAALLSGCAAEGGSYLGSGQWSAKADPEAPSIPQPQQPGTPGSGGGSNDPQGEDDMIRAIGLDQPAAIAALPDGTALVGERASGQVTRVHPIKELAQEPLYVVPDVDGSTGYGLIAMAASPRYAENGLVYAFITTATDGRVISLNKAGVPKDVVTGLPKGPAAMAFGPDGSLLVATGGSDSEFAGKILTINHWGEPGPAATAGIVMGPGVPNPLAMCSDDTRVYVVEGGSGPPGNITGNGVHQVVGTVSDNEGMSSAMGALISYAGDSAGAAGCVATGVEIVTAGMDSQSLATSVLGQGGSVVADPLLSLTGEYGRLRVLALDPLNGGMWLGTYNRDGVGSPAEDDDKILYLEPPAGGGGAGIS